MKRNEAGAGGPIDKALFYAQCSKRRRVYMGLCVRSPLISMNMKVLFPY